MASRKTTPTSVSRSKKTYGRSVKTSCQSLIRQQCIDEQRHPSTDEVADFKRIGDYIIRTIDMLDTEAAANDEAGEEIRDIHQEAVQEGGNSDEE